MKLFLIEEIIQLLQQLNERQADDLEGQHLDFKEWNYKSLKVSVDEVIDMAVCMANGGGGSIVFGVRDKVVGIEGNQPNRGVNSESGFQADVGTQKGWPC